MLTIKKERLPHPAHSHSLSAAYAPGFLGSLYKKASNRMYNLVSMACLPMLSNLSSVFKHRI